MTSKDKKTLIQIIAFTTALVLLSAILGSVFLKLLDKPSAAELQLIEQSLLAEFKANDMAKLRKEMLANVPCQPNAIKSSSQGYLLICDDSGKKWNFSQLYRQIRTEDGHLRSEFRPVNEPSQVTVGGGKLITSDFETMHQQEHWEVHKKIGINEATELISGLGTGAACYYLEEENILVCLHAQKGRIQ